MRNERVTGGAIHELPRADVTGQKMSQNLLPIVWLTHIRHAVLAVQITPREFTAVDQASDAQVQALGEEIIPTRRKLPAEFATDLAAVAGNQQLHLPCSRLRAGLEL